MPQPRRLSALDRVFLDLDTAETPQQVGWVIRFNGEPPSLGELRAHVEPRLEQLPLFRMRVIHSPRRLGAPAWAACDEFSIADHIVAAQAPEPGDDQALGALTSQLLAARLERGLPLWRLWLVGGLEHGWAIAGHGHHALIDGIAAVEVAKLLLDPIPSDRRGPEKQSLRPRIRPTTGGGRRNGRGNGNRGRARGLIQGARMMVTRAPATTLDDAGDGRRSIGIGSVDLHSVKARARDHGATANDALLVATSRTLRRELDGRGDRPAWIKALMPFRLRGDTNGRAAGNEISAVTVRLPLTEADDDEMFRLITAATKAGKTLGNAGLMSLLARGAGFVPSPLRPAVTRLVYRRLRFQVIVSNLRGPPVDVGLLGRTAVAIHPFVPITQGQGLSIGAMTYRGRMWLGVNANAALVDAPAVAQALEQALAELESGRGAISAS